jgi:hypothetical protein
LNGPISQSGVPINSSLRVAQQINQEWVNVGYLSRMRVENQDSVFGGFEEPPISQLRSTERLFRVLGLRFFLHGLPRVGFQARDRPTIRWSVSSVAHLKTGQN